MTFHKTLSRYYLRWFRDCHDSAVYCRRQGNEKKAQEYLAEAKLLFNIITEHWDAIEYFSTEDNAFRRNVPDEFKEYR